MIKFLLKSPGQEFISHEIYDNRPIIEILRNYGIDGSEITSLGFENLCAISSITAYQTKTKSLVLGKYSFYGDVFICRVDEKYNVLSIKDEDLLYLKLLQLKSEENSKNYFKYIIKNWRKI